MSGGTTIDPKMYWSPAVAKIIERARDDGLITLLSDDERNASRHELLKAAKPGEPVWVFAYGSLMWNPDFPIAESRAALVRGWHRRFCFWTVLGRGTPERPGLMLALEPGGSCRGLALAIAPDKIEAATDRIWRREMLAGAYIPRWLEADTRDGPVQVISFVVNPEFERHAGRLEDEEVAQHIAHAEGPSGPCIDYLIHTVAALDKIGHRSGPMHDLLNRAWELRGAKS
jgi:glutathione-specific gamma-glutamylcyclotransferase